MSAATDLDLALKLADAADSLTIQRFRAGDLVISSKPDLTPVTDADQAVEQMIRDRLASDRPGDAFFGEETGGDEPASDVDTASVASASRRWVVDPIDGTANFVRGVPIWATLIALLEADQPVLGVVSAPALGRRWWASLGAGAFIKEGSAPARPISVSKVAELADASLSYASLRGWRELERFNEFLELTDAVWRSRAYGDFYSYMLLAEGAVDLVAEPELSLWDMAALAPIVTEAGGRFSGVNGVDGIHQGNALASNGYLHSPALSVIGTSPS